MDVQDIQFVIVHGREIWEEDLYIPLVLVSVSYREIRWKTIFTWEEAGKLLFTWSELCELASEKQEKVLYKKAFCSYFELCQIGVREALSLEEMKNLSDTPENIFIEILFGDPKQKDITQSVYSSSEEIRNDLMSLSIEPDKVYRAKYPYSQPIPYRRKSRKESSKNNLCKEKRCDKMKIWTQDYQNTSKEYCHGWMKTKRGNFLHPKRSHWEEEAFRRSAQYLECIETP